MVKNYVSLLFCISLCSCALWPFERNYDYKDVKMEKDTIYDKEGNPINGKLNIPAQNGKNAMSCQFVNGAIEGRCAEYYPDGKIAKEQTIRNGSIQGLSKEYYPDGALMVETPFVNGKREGLQKEYRANGTLFAETPYKNNLADGLRKKYDEHGNLAVETPFTNGLINGEGKIYFPDTGQIRKQTMFENGQIIGWFN